MTGRLTAILIATVAVGCSQSGDRSERTATTNGSPRPPATASPSAPASPSGAATQLYDIRGTVESLARDRQMVTLDHETIPGLMGAMKMEYRVSDAAVLSGIAKGDRVEGKLEARGDQYLITRLHKR